jgi:hypothetical protein
MGIAMLREFIHTVYGLVVRGKFKLLRDYLDLIAKILAAGNAEPGSLEIIFGAPKPKE